MYKCLYYMYIYIKVVLNQGDFQLPLQIGFPEEISSAQVQTLHYTMMMILSLGTPPP